MFLMSLGNAKVQISRKIAYVPTLEDVNILIAGSGKKLAAFLSLSKKLQCDRAKLEESNG